MPIIDSRGVVDDGQPSLTVAGGETVQGTCATGANVMIASTLAVSGNIAIPTSGFFQVAATLSGGAGNFTGSLPSPATWSGADIMIVETAGNAPILLTGSMAIMSTVGSTISSTAGTKLTLSKGGSIVMASDTVKWVICAVNGTGSLAP